MTVEWKAGAHALSVVLGLAMVVMGCGGGHIAQESDVLDTW